MYVICTKQDYESEIVVIIIRYSNQCLIQQTKDILDNNAALMSRTSTPKLEKKQPEGMVASAGADSTVTPGVGLLRVGSWPGFL